MRTLARELTPYCSVWPVRYDISCGGTDPFRSVCQAEARGGHPIRMAGARRGILHSRTGRQTARATAVDATEGRPEEVQTDPQQRGPTSAWNSSRSSGKRGFSASQIAGELGNITRNAVIGKVHRLGLAGRAKSLLDSARGRARPRPQQHMMRISRPLRPRQHGAGTGLQGRGRSRIRSLTTMWCR